MNRASTHVLVSTASVSRLLFNLALIKNSPVLTWLQSEVVGDWFHSEYPGVSQLCKSESVSPRVWRPGTATLLTRGVLCQPGAGKCLQPPTQDDLEALALSECQVGSPQAQGFDSPRGDSFDVPIVSYSDIISSCASPSESWAAKPGMTVPFASWWYPTRHGHGPARAT